MELSTRLRSPTVVDARAGSPRFLLIISFEAAMANLLQPWIKELDIHKPS